MTEISLSFEVTSVGDPQLAREAIADRLAIVPEIEDVSADVVEVTAGFADPVTLIAAAVVLTKGGTTLVASLRELIAELKGLRDDVHGVKAIRAKVGGKEVALDDVDPDAWAAQAAVEP
jgi:hypothetical protein